MKIGVITFPGSLDEGDARRAVRLAGADPIDLWHAEADLKDADAVIIPGGASYGDYLRAGALASDAPIMQSVIDRAKTGLPVLGIGNGFQILTEAGLLPGALLRNDSQEFVVREETLRVESVSTTWTSGYESGAEIILPLKSGYGSYQGTDKVIDELEAEGRVVLRYADNPNGSRSNIAGISNDIGTIVGLMPHPEHAVEKGYGPDTPAGHRTGTDGLIIFQSITGALR